MERPLTMWRPFWLRRAVLAGFLFMYAALLTVVLLVRNLSVKYNGFFVANSTSHYAWTYGPTAVLVLATSLWRQVDYYCKTLTPWSQMHKGPASASLTILLDYVSPFQCVAFVKALKEGHIAVVASIAGFGLLKLITIISTGFLVLSTTTLSNVDYPMMITTKIDASKFNLTNSLLQSSADPVYAYYGHLAHGLQLGTGVTQNSAYTTFEPLGKMLANATLVAEVEALIPEYNCTTLDSKPGFVNETSASVIGNLPIELPDGVICQRWSDFSVVFNDPRLESVPPKKLSSSWDQVSCNDTNNEDSDLGAAVTIYTLMDTRFAQTPVLNESNNIFRFTNTSWEVAQLVTVACVPSYRIVKVSVTNDTTISTGLTVGPLGATVARTSDNLTGSDMEILYQDMFLSISNLFGTEQADGNSSATIETDTLFTLMALSEKAADIGVFLDSKKLINAAQNTFQGIMSLWFHSNFISYANEPITGSATYTANRLYVVESSLWAMVAGFLLLILITIVVLLNTTETVTTGDPNTIGASAAVLVHSEELNELLSDVNAVSSATLKAGLSFLSFSTAITSRDRTQAFKIEVSGKSLEKKIRTGKTTAESIAWRPITLTIPVILLTVILPVVLIGVLEVLQRSSDHNNGILDIAKGSERYARYVPALIMLLVATLFSSLDFNVSTFTPYSTLYTGCVPSKPTICSNFVGRMPPIALLKAAQSGHFGVVASTVAALVGSTLTIVVSGLYTVQDVSSTSSTRNLKRADTFNLTCADSLTTDNFAASVLSLVENVNLSYPLFTYSEIALPRFSLGSWTNPPKGGSTLNGPAFGSVPAIRGNLRCTIVPKSNVTIETEDLVNLPTASVNANFSLPSDCQLGGSDGNSSISSYTNQFQLPIDAGAYAGALIDLRYGAGASNVTYVRNLEELPESSEDGVNPPGCPSLAFTFGYFELNSTEKSNVTTMICFQEMQEVRTNITLLLNSTELDATRPPLVDESSIKTLENGASGSTAFQYRIQNNLATEFPNGNGGEFQGGGASSDLFTMDAFFQAVTNGSEKIAPELLVGPDNEQRLFHAINHFYRKYMAQAVNYNMRSGCDGPIGSCSGVYGSSTMKRQVVTDPGEELSDLTVTVSTPRLLQNAQSKLILQIMLGFMNICAVSAYWFTKMRNLLPYNPCSIAGTMGLLAGSELCRSNAATTFTKRLAYYSPNSVSKRDQQGIIPMGAVWITNKELREMFDEHQYSLGWWRNGDGGQERYGIDVGKPTGLHGMESNLQQKVMQGGGGSWI